MNDIAVVLSANTRDFKRGMQEAQSDLKGLRMAFDSARKVAVGFFTFTSLKTGFGVLKDTIGRLDDLAAQADRLGVSTEFLSEIQEAAKLSDTDIEALNGGLEKLEKNLGKATVEGSDLTKMLKRAGLDASQLARQGPEEAFLAIAEAVASIEDPFQRAAFVTDIFGKSGQSLLGILSRGREGIAALRSEVRSLGGTLTSDGAAKISEADDAFKRLHIIMEGLKKDFAVAIAPDLVPLLQDIASAMRSDVLPILKDTLSVLKEFRPELQFVVKHLTVLGQVLTFYGKLKGIWKGLNSDPFMDAVPPGGAAGPVGAARRNTDLGGPKKEMEFKSFAKPIEIMSKEGFSLLARTLTKPSASNVGQQQLAQAKKTNELLAKIAGVIASLPKVAPPF